ncbi:G-protein coupled receptor Mth2-like [Pogonomyrmex barbatus]|uniref:G-protein coupled receptor Mth2-like n=1 Tax=Pogonomyrmex barbatus TaxID=144034 RepID=A0A6I9W3E5_9HYME|nr:G-protein coupled receptor Mth2-like [Pogonomyrmex barbatus]
MHPSNTVYCCYIFLLIASFSESWENPTNDSEENLTVRYNLPVNYTRNETEYQFDINFMKNSRINDDVIQYKFRKSVTNFTEVNDNNAITLQEINKNQIQTESGNNFTSYKRYGNFNTDDYNNSMAVRIVPYEKCNNNICIQLCCSFGDYLTLEGKCIAGQGNYSFPNVYKYKNDIETKRLDQLFPMTVHDPCSVQEFGRILLHYNEYLFLKNGTLYRGPNQLTPPTSYCIAIVKRSIYDVIVCNYKRTKLPMFISACLVVSLPFLLLTFVMYSILPELQNMHGYTLRAHVASLFVTYIIMPFGQQIDLRESKLCIPLAYILNFSFLSSFFWLNIICFDIWWTFRELCSHQSVKHQKKKKLIIYSIYAWGIAFILTSICAIMDYVPLSEKFIRPEMCKKKFWFSQNKAKTLYFFVPIGATVVSNIGFFIATTLTIVSIFIHRFRMYLKLFIVMGITWVLEIIGWSLYDDLAWAPIIWYPANTINALQGLIIFIIFVCRKKILQQLLKRFNWQDSAFAKMRCCKVLMSDDSAASDTTSQEQNNMQNLNPSDKRTEFN